MDATLRDAAMETGEPPEPPQEGGKRSYFYGKRGKQKNARNLKSGKNIKSRRNGDVNEENPAISSARMTAPTDRLNTISSSISLRAASRHIPKRELEAAVVEGASMLKQAITYRDEAEKQCQRTEGKLAVANETIRACRANLREMKQQHKTANVHLKRVESALEVERGRKAEDLAIATAETKARNSIVFMMLRPSFL